MASPRKKKYTGPLYATAAGSDRELLDSVIMSLVAEVEEVIQADTARRSTTEQTCTDRSRSISVFKEQLLDTLNKMGARAVNESEAILDEQTCSVNNCIASCRGIFKTSNDIGSKLQELHDTKQDALLEAMQGFERKLTTLREDLDKAKKMLPTRNPNFHPNQEMTNFITSNERLGNFASADSILESPESRTDNPINVGAKHVTDIVIRSENEKFICFVSGCVFLSKRKLVIVDFHNGKIKLIGTVAGEILTDLELCDGPWDVTNIDDSTVAVTIARGRKIAIVKIENSMSLERHISVNGNCHGITFKDGSFVVAFDGPSKIEIINSEGGVLKTINLFSIAEMMSPQFVKISGDYQSFYVTDSTKSLAHVSHGGHVISKCTSGPWFAAKNLCVGPGGCVYVCNEVEHKVHILSPDCHQIETMLTSFDGLFDPVSIAWCAETNKMCIGMNGDVVKVYQLTSQL